MAAPAFLPGMACLGILELWDVERDVNPEDLGCWEDLGLLAVLPWGADPHDPGSAPEGDGKGVWKVGNPIPGMFLSLGMWDLPVGTWSMGDLRDICPKFLSRAGISTGSVTYPLSQDLE